MNLKRRFISFFVTILFMFLAYCGFLYSYPIYCRFPVGFYCLINFSHFFFIFFLLCLLCLLKFINIFISFISWFHFTWILKNLKKQLRFFFFNFFGYFLFFYSLFFFSLLFLFFIFFYLYCVWFGGYLTLPWYAFNALQISNQIWEGSLFLSCCFNLCWDFWDVFFYSDFLCFFFHFTFFYSTFNFFFFDFLYQMFLLDVFFYLHDSHILYLPIFSENLIDYFIPLFLWDSWSLWYEMRKLENWEFEKQVFQQILNYYFFT